MNNKLLSPVTEVFGKSDLWGSSLKIFEFRHEAPSRSGEATISVVVAGDDANERKLSIVAYAHHEGLSSYYPAEWIEYVSFQKKELLNPNVDKYSQQDAENIIAIDNIIQSLLV